MILIVDDKPENLFSLKSLLQLHLYEVETALSGGEALRKILKQEFELIILDVQMPEMDGYEVAESLAGYSKTKNIPIIFLSAVNIDKRFITKGYDSGGVDYITKPFDPDLLLLKVKTFCRLYRQTRELKQIQEVLRREIEVRRQAQKALEEINFSLEEKIGERTKSLLDSNRKLEASNAELQQFTSIASHDLQEPLRKISTFSHLLSEFCKEEGSEASLYLRKIIHSSERMRNLINDLLNYSKLSMDSQFLMTPLQSLLQDTLNDLELSIREKKARVDVSPIPAAEVIPGQIRQVFQNIISNALKFSHSEKPIILEIWSDTAIQKSLDAPAAANGTFLRIYFRDNGIGFDEVYLDRIFTMFQRLHGKDEFEGTGIGLAIVKKIVENHHGFIGARSQEGKGSTFIIVIPIHQHANQPEPEK